MTDKDDSVRFIESQIDKNFSGIMKDQIIQEMFWLDYSDHARAVSIMYDPMLEENKDNNLVCLFPPFYKTDK